MRVKLAVHRGNVLDFPADVLLLKYARSFHGADQAVSSRLVAAGLATEAQLEPAVWDPVQLSTRGVLAAQRLLLLGTPALRQFGYPEMRVFARKAVSVLAASPEPIRTLALTLHGAGYGLDPLEGLQALVAGLQQGLAESPLRALTTVTFVERNPRLAEVVERGLASLPPLLLPAEPSATAPTPPPTPTPAAAAPKRRVFVAMPFNDSMEDVWQFGIYETVRRCGYICERVDESSFVGNIIERIREGIRGSAFVLADLTDARPNVYLEVGYAWGIEKPVILVARDGTLLHFDLAQHKCLFYKSAYRLSQDLEEQIRGLGLAG